VTSIFYLSKVKMQKPKLFISNQDGNILFVWFFVFVGLFILSMSYFFIYPAIHESLSAFSDVSCIDGCSVVPGGSLADNQQWFVTFNNRLDTNWRFAHIMIGVGLILYGMLRSIRREFHTYARNY